MLPTVVQTQAAAASDNGRMTGMTKGQMPAKLAIMICMTEARCASK